MLFYKTDNYTVSINVSNEMMDVRYCDIYKYFTYPIDKPVEHQK